MLKIEGNEIKVTRGDSLAIELTLKKGDEEYIPEEGDKIRFAISDRYKGEAGYKLHLTKEIPHDTMLIRLTPQETSDFRYKKYNYDIEITYASGEVDTFISSHITFTGESE